MQSFLPEKCVSKDIFKKIKSFSFPGIDITFENFKRYIGFNTKIACHNGHEIVRNKTTLIL